MYNGIPAGIHSPGLDYGNGAYCNYPDGHNDYYSDVKWNSCGIIPIHNQNTVSLHMIMILVVHIA